MNKIKLTSINNSEIPLKNIKIDLDICNQIGQFTLTQTYINEDTNPIEAYYTFPTPAFSSVHTFEARIGEKIIKTILKEKDTAIKDYNEAISQGNGAYLMERIEGDIFSVNLGNIAPKMELTIIIKYVIEVRTEIDCSQLRVNIPLTIMPKYMMNVDESPEKFIHNTLVNPVKISNNLYNFKLNGTIFMNDGIISLDSKTSKIKISNMKEKSLNFEITDFDELNEDIILTIKRNKPQTNALTQKADILNINNEIFRYATMVNIIPDFKKIPDVDATDIHYTLILDRSGSMAGSDFINCKEAAKLFISLLPIGSSFDIYHFGSDFDKFILEPNLQMGSIESKQNAIQWVNDIPCNGGTEIYNVLIDAYKSIKDTEKSGAIILLSDGGISNVDDVLKLVKANKNINMFTIGIGQSVSQHLIQSMADEGNGKAEFINSGSDQLKEKVIVQLNRAKNSIRKFQKNNNVHIQIYGNYRMVPEIIPTLYENDVNTFYIFSQNPVQSITYTQNLESYNRMTNIQLTPVTNEDYLLHRMAGIKLIENLQNNKNGSQIPHLKQDVHKDEIIGISLNLGILSKYTSFIGIEYCEEKDKIIEQTSLKEIPLQHPKKYHNDNRGGGCAEGLFQLVLNNKNGSIGPIGSIGEIGPMGDVGCHGPIGSIEEIGPMGSIGEIGPMGDVGCHGPKGMDLGTTNSCVSNPILNDSFFDLTKFDMVYKSDTIFNNVNEIDFIKNHKDNLEKKEINSKVILMGKIKKKCPKIVKFDLPNNKEREKEVNESQVKHNIKLIVHEKLKNYVKLSEYILSSIQNEILPFAEKVNVNDYVSLINEEENNGVYKIIHIGSNDCPWILEKISNSIF